VAYKAEIAVDVRGLKDVKTLETSLNKISGKINAINKVSIGNSKAARVEKQVLNTKTAQADMMSKTRRIGDLVQKQADKGLKVGLAQEAVSKSALLNSKKEFTESKRLLKVALDELKVQKSISKEIGQQSVIKSSGKRSGPTSSLTSLGRGTPLGLSGVQAFPQTKDLGMFGPKSPFMGQSTGFGRSPVRGTSLQFGSPSFFDAGAKAGGARSPVSGTRFDFGSPAQQAFSGGPSSSIKGSRFEFGSPTQQAFSGGPSSSIKGSRFEFGSPAQRAFSGGPSIPVKGSKDIYGSPAYYAATNKEAKRVAKANAMPIQGFKDLPGSPAYFKDQAQKLKDSPISSGLNFDKNTGKLLRGPAGSGGGGLRNLGRRFGPSKGFDTQSALISGAFPLLFGQGPVGALAGGLGGGIGGMFGGMGGFAGGIAATAAVQSIQNVINGIGELGQAMNRLNPNISAMSTAMGISGTLEEKRLQLIEKNMGKQAAFNAALEMMGQKIGADKAEELRKFGETFQKLGNDVTLFFTKVQAAIAKLLNQALDAGANANVRGRARSLVAQNPNNRAFFDVNQRIEGIQNREAKGAAANKQKTRDLNAAKAERLEIAESLVLQKDKDKLRVQTNKLITAGLGDLKKENELNRAIKAGKEEEFLVQEAIKNKAEEMGLVFKDLESGQQNRIRDAVTINKGLKEQAENAKAVRDAFESINQSIATDIKDGIAGLIKGTSTLSDMLNNVANKFLDLALNQALFGDALGAGGKKGGGILGFLTGGLLAEGGRAAGGKSFIVGERGPELFVPKSSGTVVPNNKLGGGGSTSVVVNVDASGSDVQGDDSGAKELGALISVAVQGELVKQQRPGGLLSSIR